MHCKIPTKTEKYTKDIEIKDIFYINDKKNNIVNHVYEFYNRNCHSNNSKFIFKNNMITAKETNYLIKKIGHN